MIKGLKEQIEITERKIKQLEDKMTPDVHFSLIDKLELEYCKNNLKYLKAVENIKKYFIIKLDVETELNGYVWGRLVSIQSREDEGEWDCTATANLADYKEDFDLFKEVLCDEDNNC